MKMLRLAKRLGIVFAAAIVVVACSGDTRTVIVRTSDNGSAGSGPITLTGTITYDFVPHETSNFTLDHANTEKRPARGIRVDLKNDFGRVVSNTSTDASGNYRFSGLQENQSYRVEVVPEVRPTGHKLDFVAEVRDDRDSKYAYEIQSAVSNTGTEDLIHDIHIASGWRDGSYKDSRDAAPFAILDGVYRAFQRLRSANPSLTLSPLTLYWEPGYSDRSYVFMDFGNKSAFYVSGEDGVAYLMGEPSENTDEFDTAIHARIVAKHYLDDRSRLDGEIGAVELDLVPGEVPQSLVAAYETGLVNALAATIVGNPLFVDTRAGQGFSENIETNPTGEGRGWNSHKSTQSILYDLIDAEVDGDDDIALGLAPVMALLESDAYRSITELHSIYLLNASLGELTSQVQATLRKLMTAQSIFGADTIGTGETNDGGKSFRRPIFKFLEVERNAGEFPSVELCSSGDPLESYPLVFGEVDYFSFTIPPNDPNAVPEQNDIGVSETAYGDEVVPSIFIAQAGEEQAIEPISHPNGFRFDLGDLEPGTYYGGLFVDIDLSSLSPPVDQICFETIISKR